MKPLEQVQLLTQLDEVYRAARLSILSGTPVELQVKSAKTQTKKPTKTSKE